MADAVYAWGTAPANLKTRAQLAELGLRPGGPEVGRIEWLRRGVPAFARLYDVTQAVAKQPATPAQLAALAKARLKRQQCPVCGYPLGHIPRRRFYPPTDCPQCFARKCQADREQAAQRAQRAVANPLTIILDTETTDLDGYAVQIAALGVDGTVLLETLVNPLAEIAPAAQAIHGLTAELLANAPVFATVEPQLRALLTGRPVWAYNADFDRGVLAREAQRICPYVFADPATWLTWVDHLEWHCAMHLYAAWVGEWNGYYGNYRWQRLPGGDHTALGDCRATLAVLQTMAEAG